VATFVGSSEPRFSNRPEGGTPAARLAAPAARAGVRLHARHRWTGWADDGALRFATPAASSRGGAAGHRARAGRGELVAPGQRRRLGAAAAGGRRAGGAAAAEQLRLRPAPPWSDFLRQRFAGQPVKPVVMQFEGRRQQGEFVLTATGIEGSLVYAFSAALREAIARDGRRRCCWTCCPTTTRRACWPSCDAPARRRAAWPRT
jgi:predicted flavoprotein YhiN